MSAELNKESEKMTENSPSEYAYLQLVDLVLRKVYGSRVRAERVFQNTKTRQDRLMAMHEDPFDAAGRLANKERDGTQPRSELIALYEEVKSSDEWQAIIN